MGAQRAYRHADELVAEVIKEIVSRAPGLLERILREKGLTKELQFVGERA